VLCIGSEQEYLLATHEDAVYPHALSPPNGMDRSCEATIYPVLDKPRTTETFQDRRKIGALFSSPSSFG
jgi:hypothetical protein